MISLNIIINSKNILNANSMNEQTIHKRKYSRISIKKREKLVQFIDQLRFTIEKAAKRTGIKASTARRIYNKYKQTGLFPMKSIKKIGRPCKVKHQNLKNKVDLLKTERIEIVQGADHTLPSTNQYNSYIPIEESFYPCFNYIWMIPQGIMCPYYFA